MAGDRVHQRRGQAVIRLESQLLEPRSDARHLRGIHARFDHGGHERRELRSRRTTLLEQFGMYEVEPIERVRLVLDPAVHVSSADAASMALDRRGWIDHLEFVTVFENSNVFARYHRDYGKD